MNILKTQEKKEERAEGIISIFEDYLHGKGIKIPNKEREEQEKMDPFETFSIIYGEEYYELREKIAQVL